MVSVTLSWDFPGSPQMVKNLPAVWETQVQSLVQEDPLKKGMATHTHSSLENSIDRGAWWATVCGLQSCT